VKIQFGLQELQRSFGAHGAKDAGGAASRLN
jgi:hypothetical protein